ncbi:unnamed protein product [Polarella glacialis]|uniref:Uncharacterized protein n=1 Tax=Polarella glacialis TaxID=89957 RepID=A0A813CZQ5_POLGL|nr:unnamed protein product [Polarella glacialis]
MAQLPMQIASAADAPLLFHRTGIAPRAQLSRRGASIVLCPWLDISHLTCPDTFYDCASCPIIQTEICCPGWTELLQNPTFLPPLVHTYCMCVCTAEGSRHSVHRCQ